ncbi:MAG: hypothetical protein WAL84_07550 [Candidatus Dormiibacterota bacterium]
MDTASARRSTGRRGATRAKAPDALSGPGDRRYARPGKDVRELGNAGPIVNDGAGMEAVAY